MSKYFRILQGSVLNLLQIIQYNLCYFHCSFRSGRHPDVFANNQNGGQTFEP